MIKWITDSLGTASWEITLDAKDFHVVDVRDLVDRPGNPSQLVTEKVQEALLHLAAGQKVVITCDYGMSRSNALAAGVLAQLRRIPFREAVDLVMSATGEKTVNIGVLAAVREAVTKTDSSGKLQKSPADRQQSTYAERSGQQAAPTAPGRRILITGATGFIGKALISALPSRHICLAPPRQELDLLNDAVRLDLLVKEQGIDCVVHLANPRIYTNNSAMGSSLVMLRNVLDSCREHRLKLIFLSSWEVYSGYRSQQLLADEGLPKLPKGPYGETKMLCELLIEHYHRHHGLEYAIIRSSPVYGDGDKPKFIYNFLNKALRGEDIWAHRYRNGFPTLDLLHISDLITAVVAVIEANAVDSVNVGSGKANNTTEVAEFIMALVESRGTVKHRTIEDWAPNVVMDINHAQSLLGWSPKTDLATGMSKLIHDTVKTNGKGALSGL